MTNLSDFLKVEKVRCVKAYGDCLTVGKEYSVLDIRMEVKVKDDEGDNCYWESDNFEPVLDSAENPLQNIELTPEFEAKSSEHKFKAGDKVYAPSVGSKIYTVKDVGDGWCYPIRIDCSYDEDHEFTKEGQITAEGLPILFLATELNHSLLSQLYGIDFERPPLTGNELCRKLLDKGEKYIMANDEHGTWRIICDYCDDWFTDLVTGECLKNITPLNSKGEPLTEAVLDE